VSHRSLVGALLVALALAGTAPAQDRPAAEQKRGAYVVKYAAAKDVAASLAKHFKGAAEIQVPEGTNNTLLVSAPPAVFDEVMKVLDTLDRKPQLVGVEVFVVELPAKKGDDKDAGIDEKELSGGIDDVAKALGILQSKGKVARVRRFEVAAQEGHPAALRVQEAVPVSTGGGSRAYRNVGTQVKVTPRVAADRTITLDLTVQDSRIVTPAGGGAPEFPLLTLDSKVSVAADKAVLAKGAKSTETEGVGPVLIVVGARLAEPK
jgi:type II secretory pathway component GspD/PulD (secretin)